MEIQKLPTVVVANEYGGVVMCTEETGEVMLMQRSYRYDGYYTIEETRFTKLQDDICRITLLDYRPGEVLMGNIVMKQRTSFKPGYVKLKNENDIPVWGRTYYTEDYDDRDELIDSFKVE